MNRKGFTLIELLAVVIILAIVALIAVPIVNTITDEAKYDAADASINEYINGVNSLSTVSKSSIVSSDYSLDVGKKHILETGVNDDELAKVDFTGVGPTYAYMIFDRATKEVKIGHFCINGFNIDYNYNEGTSKSYNDYCNGDWVDLSGSGLFDENDELVASWEELVDDYGLLIEDDYASYESTYDNSCSKNPHSGYNVLKDPALATGVKLVIPAIVKKIGGNAMCNEDLLETVVFPKSLQTINSYAFSNNSKLKNIVFAEDGELELINQGAFENNYSIEELTIPASVKYIKNHAFASSNDLIPMNITNITFEAGSQLEYLSGFDNNQYLEKIDIPESVKVIGDYAFYNNRSMTSLYIPKNVERINESAFSGEYDHNCLANSTGLRCYLDSTKPMRISTITFAPDSKLQDIGPRAFYNNNSLTDIEFPSSLKNIKNQAFSENSSLTNVTFNEGLKIIGYNSFEQDQQIKEIVIPSSVVEIQDIAFAYDYNIGKITFAKDEYGNNALEKIDYSAFRLNTKITELEIPKSVKYIGTFAFGANSEGNDYPYYMNIEKLTFEKESVLETIEANAFRCNKYLKELTIPASVKFIGGYAFSPHTSEETGACSDSSIEKLTFEEGSKLEYIGAYAFTNHKLKELTIPASVSWIYNNAFAQNGNSSNKATLKTIIFEPNYAQNSFLNMYTAVFQDNASVVEVKLPPQLKGLWEKSFYGLAYATIDFSATTSNFTYIKKYAFTNNQVMTSITIPESVKKIGEGIFNNSRIETIKVKRNQIYNSDGELYADGNNNENRSVSPFWNCRRYVDKKGDVPAYCDGDDYINVEWLPE